MRFVLTLIVVLSACSSESELPAESDALTFRRTPGPPMVGSAGDAGSPEDAIVSSDARIVSPDAQIVSPDAQVILSDTRPVPLDPTQMYGGHIYLFVSTAMTWTDARAYCYRYGFHLVTIEDAAENTWLAASSRMTLSSSGWWMGLNDRDKEGVFVWEDGSLSSYRAWGPDQPNNTGGVENCVQFRTFRDSRGLTDYWTDKDCDFPGYPFVCEAP